MGWACPRAYHRVWAPPRRRRPCACARACTAVPSVLVLCMFIVRPQPHRAYRANVAPAGVVVGRMAAAVAARKPLRAIRRRCMVAAMVAPLCVTQCCVSRWRGSRTSSLDQGGRRSIRVGVRSSGGAHEENARKKRRCDYVTRSVRRRVRICPVYRQGRAVPLKYRRAARPYFGARRCNVRTHSACMVLHGASLRLYKRSIVTQFTHRYTPQTGMSSYDDGAVVVASAAGGAAGAPSAAGGLL